MPERTDEGRSVDVLAELFETVHVLAAKVSRLEVPSPCTLQVGASRAVVIYVVLRGSLSLEVSTPEPTCKLPAGGRITATTGGVIWLPKGDAHTLGGDATTKVQSTGVCEVSKARLLESPRDGLTSVLRATCSLSDPTKNPLLGVLPQALEVESSSQPPGVKWLEPLTAMLLAEASEDKPGTSSVISRLLELLVLQLVRNHIASTPVSSHGWLRALSDSQIGGAIGLIHEKPADTFTVAGLAHAVGMSRSAFASQFTRLVGEPPLHYVARWRMLKAAQLLSDNRLTLAEIAAAVGYESEAAFSKAFKRWSGQAPGCYRREQRNSDIAPAPQALAG